MAPAASATDEGMQHDAEPTSAPSHGGPGPRKRPKLDLTMGLGERKRGKTMFGLLVGTLNRAKIEDKERNASDAVRILVSGMVGRRF